MIRFANKIFFLFLLITSFNFSQSNFKFAWLTDTHIGSPKADEDLLRSVNDINFQDDISFTIISGDVSNIGTYAECCCL